MTIYEIFFTDGSSYILMADRVDTDLSVGFLRFDILTDVWKGIYEAVGYFNLSKIRGYVVKGEI